MRSRVERSRSRTDRGFTLIELLVSITLMSLVAVAIHSGFRLSLNSWEKSEKALQRQRTLQFVLDLITRQVGSMVPFYSRQQLEGVPVDVLLFQDSAQGVRFVSSFSSEARAADGLRLVEYFLTDSPTGEGKVLMMNETALPQSSELVGKVFSSLSRGEDNYVVPTFSSFAATSDSVVLAQDLIEAHFEYTRKAKDEDVPAAGASNVLLPGRQGELMAFFNRKGRASNKRNQLPLGLRLKLGWKEGGYFQMQEFSIVVPIQAGV